MRSGPRPQAPNTIQIDGEEATDRGTFGVTGPDQVPVDAGSFFFSPTLITGPPGTEIQLDFTTGGDQTHNFSLPDQAIDQDLTPGSAVGVTATFPDMGTLVFFCKYHREQGMLGGLTAA